jgi:hypothetical protein
MKRESTRGGFDLYFSSDTNLMISSWFARDGIKSTGYLSAISRDQLFSSNIGQDPL